jgi:hypothetical protein
MRRRGNVLRPRAADYIGRYGGEIQLESRSVSSTVTGAKLPPPGAGKRNQIVMHFKTNFIARSGLPPGQEDV